jgi:glycosyltransferase involved in cell wall biosynthesis
LPDCLESLLNQTYQNIEIIAVDDLSTDNSAQIVADFQQAHPTLNLKLVSREQNGGLSAARNSGLEVATGEYIYFLDPDDFISPELIQKCVILFEIDPVVDVVAFELKSFVDKNAAPGTQEWVPKPHNLEDGQTYTVDEVLRRNNYVFQAMAWKYMTRMSVFKDNGLTNCEGIIHEDELITPQVLLHSRKLGYLADKLYQKREREGQISNSLYGASDSLSRAQRNIDGYEGVVQGLNILLERDSPEAVSDAFRKYITKTITYILYVQIPKYRTAAYAGDAEFQAEMRRKYPAGLVLRAKNVVRSWMP